MIVGTTVCQLGSRVNSLGPNDFKELWEILEWAFATAQYNMMVNAENMDATGIVSVRFETMQNKYETIEVVAYGTGVVVEESGPQLNEFEEPMPQAPPAIYDPESMDAIG